MQTCSNRRASHYDSSSLDSACKIKNNLHQDFVGKKQEHEYSAGSENWSHLFEELSPEVIGRHVL